MRGGSRAAARWYYYYRVVCSTSNAFDAVRRCRARRPVSLVPDARGGGGLLRACADPARVRSRVSERGVLGDVTTRWLTTRTRATTASTRVQRRGRCPARVTRVWECGCARTRGRVCVWGAGCAFTVGQL